MSWSKRAICTLTSFLAGYGHEFIIMQTFASHSSYEPPKNFTTYFVNSPYLYIYVFYIIYKSKVGWFRCFCPSQSTDKPRYLRYIYEGGTINVPCISKSASIRNWVTFCVWMTTYLNMTSISSPPENRWHSTDFCEEICFVSCFFLQ